MARSDLLISLARAGTTVWRKNAVTFTKPARSRGSLVRYFCKSMRSRVMSWQLRLRIIRSFLTGLSGDVFRLGLPCLSRERKR